MRIRLAVVTLALSTSAYAYDDPAVALCEYALKGEMTSVMVYERIDAELRSTAATLRYSVQVLSTAPKEYTITCPFRMDVEAGGFVVDVPMLPSGADCSIERSALERYMLIQKNQGIAPGSEMAEKRDQAIADLSACLEMPDFDWGRRALLARFEGRMRETGIYPIDAADTALGE